VGQKPDTENKMNKISHITPGEWGIIFTTGLLLIYLFVFTQIKVENLHQLSLKNFEVYQESERKSGTLFREKLGGDLIFKTGKTGYHFPEKIWKKSFTADSLLTIFRNADAVTLWLRDATSSNIFGVRCGDFEISPQTGVDEFNKLRRWFFYLIVLLYAASGIDMFLKRSNKRKPTT